MFTSGVTQRSIYLLGLNHFFKNYSVFKHIFKNNNVLKSKVYFPHENFLNIVFIKGVTQKVHNSGEIQTFHKSNSIFKCSLKRLDFKE